MHENMIRLQDDLGREVDFPHPPRRVISLCPSITETLYALVEAERIVGRTRYCIHPADRIEGAAVVGGTKQVDFARIEELSPDLIIAEKEENPKEMVEQLAEKYPVYVFDVKDYGSALHMIRGLGKVLGCEEASHTMVQQIEREFRVLSEMDASGGSDGLGHFDGGPAKMIEPDASNRVLHGERRPTVAYLIWRKPYMAVGRNTFIHSMLETCGFENMFADRRQGERYPSITVDDLAEGKPDYIFLSSEPFPFTERHAEELAKDVPDAAKVLVDGEMFSWYGVRMLQAPRYLKGLLQQLESTGPGS